MSVAHVTSSASHASASFSVSQASFSWTHTTTTNPQGVLVLVFQGVASTDVATSVTYDGVTVPAVSGGFALDSTTEPGTVKAFFLGASVPTTDNPTVVVNRTNNTTTMWAVCATVTAASDTEAVGVVLLSGDGAIAEQSVSDGSSASNSVRYAGAYYGGATPAPAGANSTLLHSNDAGAYGWTAVRETAAGQGSRSVGCTQATSDDRAGVHLAIREVVGTATPSTVTAVASIPAPNITTGGGGVAPVVASSAQNNGTANYTVAVPTGTANNDLLIGVVASDFGTFAGNTFPTPAWTALSTSSYNAGTDLYHVALFARVASSEPANYTVSVNGSADSAAGIIRVTGWDLAGGIAGIVQVAPNTTGNGTTSPTITPNGTDDLLITVHSGEFGGNTITWTPPAGMTEHADAQSTTWTALEVCSLQNPSSPSGTKTATPSVSPLTTGAGCAISIKAPSGGATPSTVAGIAAVPSVTVRLGVAIVASAVLATAIVPAPSVSTGSNATVTPAAVVAAASVPAPTMHAGSTVVPSAVSTAAAVPSPSVSSGSNATASPAAVHGAAAVPAPTVRLSSFVTVTTVTGVASVSTPTVVAHKYLSGASANGRYFVDQDGVPFLLRGDSPWAMFTKLSSSEVDTYLANRVSKGTNTLLVSMIGAPANGGPSSTGATYDGVLPFTGGDPTVFNSTYWSRMDSYIAKARNAGLTLMIYPIDGWTTQSGNVFDTASVTTTQAQAYGNALATRYASYPNIIWAFGGDYTETTALNNLMGACLTGIRAAGDTRLVTVQLSYDTSESDNSTYWEPKVNFDFVYEYFVTYKGMKDAYDHSWTVGANPKPALFGEGAYEGASGLHPGTDLVIRRQAGWALTSGSPGEFTGQEGVWDFQASWATLLNSTATSQLKAIRDAVQGVAWWTLIPDDSNQLVTAGRGTRVTTDSATYPTGNTFVTAARAADGSLAVIYLPNASSAITVDMTKIGATPTATWVDPTSGATFSATVGSSYSRGNNAAGSTDWLLILTGLAGTTVTPSTITGTAAVPSPTFSTGSVAAPSAVAAVSSVPAPVISLGIVAVPGAVAAVAAVPSPTLAGNATVTASTVSGTAAVPSPSVSAGTKATPAAVAGIATVPSPAVSAGGSATAAPSTVVATAAVPAASLNTGSKVTASPVAAVAAIPAPVVVAGSSATATPAAVAASAAIPAPSVRISPNPVTVSATAAVPTPSMHTSVLVSAFSVAAVAAVPSLTVLTFIPVTVRPNTGRTIRPNTGTTQRP